MLPESNFSVILGVDFLSRHNFQIDFVNSMLLYNSYEFPLNTISKSVAPVLEVPETPSNASREEFHVNPAISRSERRSLDNVLFTYADCFYKSEHLHDMGRTTLVIHQILLHDTRPHKVRPYRMPKAVQETIDASIKIMLENGM